VGVEQVRWFGCKQLVRLIPNFDGIKTWRQDPISIFPVFIIDFCRYVRLRKGHFLKLITLKQTFRVVGRWTVGKRNGIEGKLFKR